MEQEMQIKFKVFIFSDTGAIPIDGRIYGLRDTHKEFDSPSEAQYWIETSGERQTDYTIIEVIKKP